MRLGRNSVLPTNVARPDYDRSAQKAGIVHFGIGAFHRAHQAVYTDDAMSAGDHDWGIIGVSLRSAGVAEQMNPQDGLYTVTERSAADDNIRLIGAVQQVLVATHDPEAVITAISSPDTHIISFTITEKGYCRAPDGSLDFDLAGQGSVYHYLTTAFRRRFGSGLPGLTLLSCDNLAGNGIQLKRLMREYLAHHGPDLIDWFETKCTCPSTMVDRIVPATTDADRNAIAAVIGACDEAAVVTEAFTQWVIEDNFAGQRPRWELGGAQFADDVAPFETAKLRMLNGAHSALAYLGLQRGHEFVHQAIADPELAGLVNTMMRDEAATSLTPARGQDLVAYAEALIARFANPALNHKLIQIAMDGSQKIPQRWLETLSHHQQRGQRCPAILEALSAWIMHLGGKGHVVDDPLRDVLQALWLKTGKAGIAQALFGAGGLFASYWQGGSTDLAEISAQLEALS